MLSADYEIPGAPYDWRIHEGNLAFAFHPQTFAYVTRTFTTEVAENYSIDPQRFTPPIPQGHWGVDQSLECFTEANGDIVCIFDKQRYFNEPGTAQTLAVLVQVLKACHDPPDTGKAPLLAIDFLCFSPDMDMAGYQNAVFVHPAMAAWLATHGEGHRFRDVEATMTTVFRCWIELTEPKKREKNGWEFSSHEPRLGCLPSCYLLSGRLLSVGDGGSRGLGPTDPNLETLAEGYLLQSDNYDERHHPYACLLGLAHLHELARAAGI